MNLDSVRENYRDLLGQVPETLEKRLALATEAGRISAIAVIEAFREVFR